MTRQDNPLKRGFYAPQRDHVKRPMPERKNG